MKNWVCGICFLFLSLSLAAPFPVSSSSVLTDPQWGNFYRKNGFSLKTESTAWVLSSEASPGIFETYRYHLKETFSEQASMSLRVDQIKSQQSLETYAKKWMKEYPQFGFEILGTKSLKMGGGQALLVDLYQKNKNQQLRQLILKKSNQVVIMTCVDNYSSFKKTLPQCNLLMNNFQWN